MQALPAPAGGHPYIRPSALLPPTGAMQDPRYLRRLDAAAGHAPAAAQRSLQAAPGLVGRLTAAQRRALVLGARDARLWGADLQVWSVPNDMGWNQTRRRPSFTVAPCRCATGRQRVVLGNKQRVCNTSN